MAGDARPARAARIAGAAGASRFRDVPWFEIGSRNRRRLCAALREPLFELRSRFLVIERSDGPDDNRAAPRPDRVSRMAVRAIEVHKSKLVSLSPHRSRQRTSATLAASSKSAGQKGGGDVDGG